MTITDQRVTAVLDRLHAEADRVDDLHVEAARPALETMPDPRALAELLGEAYLPVPREVGELLHTLVRGTRARTVVEFGSSFGISTLYLAAAVRDGGSGGRVISTELHPGKAAAARGHLAEAGLGACAEVRTGDALETLGDVAGPIDLLLLDGWEQLYLPVLVSLRARLRVGALIVADDTEVNGGRLSDYLAHVRAPGNGYHSLPLAIGDGLELTTVADGAH
ncbi:O-methyltransferase [Crossiella sp. NPDC003009]